MTQGKPIRLGVLGAANIARALLKGIKDSPLIKATAIASRDLEKARAFADEYGVETAHGSYEALLADPDLDAIYVPLPNTLHKEWVIKALNAGKHVMCEKPLSVTLDEARQMFAAAHANGKRLVEVYPYRAQEQTLALQKLLAENAIGRLQTVHASFGVMFTDPANIRLDPDRGGGALLDAGSYAMNFIRLVAGEKPRRVNALARWGESKVDLTVVANLDFPSGLVGQLTCSFATAYHRHAIIAGSGGILETTFLNHPPEAGPPELHLRKGIPNSTPRETITLSGGNGFLAEAESFARLLTDGDAQWTGCTEQESLDTIATLEAIAKSVRSEQWEAV